MRNNKETRCDNSDKTMTTRNMVIVAMMAALYTTLCMVLAPLSFGMVQIRAAEALTLLPIFSFAGVWGVTLGCALSNLVGFFTGVNILGAIDIVFGTFATFLAALLTRKFRHIRILGLPVVSAIPPVLINAVVIGAELSFIIAPKAFMTTFVINFIYVAVGQFLSCFILGLPFIWMLEKTGTAYQCFGNSEK